MTWFSLSSCYGVLTSFFMSLSTNSITRKIWLNHLRFGWACSIYLRSLTLSEKLLTIWFCFIPSSEFMLFKKSKLYYLSARRIYSSKATGSIISYSFVVNKFCGMRDSFFRILISLKVFLAMYGSSNTFFISLIATSCLDCLSCALMTKPNVPYPIFPSILYSFYTYWKSGSIFFDSMIWRTLK